MNDFFIDRHGGCDEENEDIEDNRSDEGDINENEEAVNGEEIDCLDDLSDLESPNEKQKAKTKNSFSLNDTYLLSGDRKKHDSTLLSTKLDEVLKKSVIKPGFEKQLSIGSKKSSRQQLAERKKLRERTKGEKWFDLPATEVTPEIKNDFEILKMRAVLDRKHVYKKNNFTKLPKYFQVGTVVESPADFYSGRVVKAERKKTLVEELLADAEFKKYQKKKYKEIMDTSRRRIHPRSDTFKKNKNKNKKSKK